jgi:DNA repair protein RecO (recombination protein O)
MGIVSADAIILQTFAYGETSRILRLLTESHGVQSAMAKGARRPRSQYGGILEPFTEGRVTLYLKDTRDLQTLSGFDLTRSHQSLGSDLMRFGGASLLSEIVLRAANEEPQPGLFSLVRDALDRIERHDVATVEHVVLSETWRLVACLGFEPELIACIDCSRPVGDDEDVKFDPGAGGIRCLGCGVGATGRLIPARALAALRAMLAAEDVPIDRTDGHWWLIQRYLEHHVLEGSALRSLGVIAAARGVVECSD